MTIYNTPSKFYVSTSDQLLNHINLQVLAIFFWEISFRDNFIV
ncbi:MAG: hypothetical protein ACD_51C00361G0002 [uncultured bacterium]|nr:MAG: hypothetical protein ACD_51C00361G0002 [uncultured bacterium]